MSSSITLAELIPTIREVVEDGREATFVPHGISMRPMLYGGRDEIILKRAKFPLKKYELPLYQRKNGTVVLHRVVGIKQSEDGEEYIMRGDNTYVNESGITRENIVAVLCRFRRKGRWYDADALSYRIYTTLWVKSFLLRKFIRFAVHLPVRVAGRLLRILKIKK